MTAVQAAVDAVARTVRSALVYCDLRGVGMLGMRGGVVVRVLWVGLVKSCVRRSLNCLSGVASEVRSVAFIFGLCLC